MSEVIAIRGHIRSDVNPLTYEWSKEGSRYFPKAMVSNAENILRFLELGYTPNVTDAQNILGYFNHIDMHQKSYLIQAVIDPSQHHFLYRVLSPIKTDEGRLRELLRIHDMWVLYFGAVVFKNNPIERLVGNGVTSHRRWAIVSELDRDNSDSSIESNQEKLNDNKDGYAVSKKDYSSTPTNAIGGEQKMPSKHQSYDAEENNRPKESIPQPSKSKKQNNSKAPTKPGNSLLDSVIKK
ncbi:hypothetical protein [Halomonas sp. KO116]|uniref:hypothetical protein n=1 Tax=Halomonas sp. KO116 TaxID=1504981 RepID=UPI00054CFF67|nr:hypothetical protein [Halomonas sp. KO116]